MKPMDGRARRALRHLGSLRAPTTALLLAVTLVISACGGDDNGGDASSTTTTERRSTASSSTTSTTEAASTDGTAKQAVVDRYIAFWQARLEANQAPVNPDHPSLAEYATGKQLENVIAETRRRRDDGLAIRRPENSVGKHDVRIVNEGTDEVTLQDCSVNDGVIYRVDSGEVVDDNVVTQSIRAIMRLVDGKWKLEQASLVQEWPGVAGCAAAG